jgi:hypothetical protein
VKVWKRLRNGEPLLLYVKGSWENVAVNPDFVFAVVAAQGADPLKIVAGEV